MIDPQAVKSQIREAFAKTQYPGDWCLRGSNEGDEPYLVEAAFKGKDDWRTIDASYLDEAHGYGSALSFFSDEAFHFYLPAYLIAHIDGQLEKNDPAFKLTHGLCGRDRLKPVNRRRYGERTWLDEARYKFSMFNRQEAAAIVAYLRLIQERDKFYRDEIEESLQNYWLERAEAKPI